MAPPTITEVPPDQLIHTRSANDAVIVWVNEAATTTGGAGDTDGFGATFGTSAPLARAVVEAVILQYQKMIGSFNYPAQGVGYGLLLA